VRPNRFQQFAYLDELMGVTRISWSGASLELNPLQGVPRSLEPVGGALFRAVGRRAATHVVMESPSGVFSVSDGIRTYERVSRMAVIARWMSAVAGVFALLFLLFAGGWPALVLWMMLLSPLLFLTQSFLAIGDLTPINVLVAALTLALPISLTYALTMRVRAGVRGARHAMHAVALAAALQWCITLAWWGLLPLTLWR
jgi:hypothetical protein